MCLLEEFRDGNASPGSGHLPFYRACQAALPAGKHLGAYRADSASYQAELINALEADGVRFSITADQDAAVKTLLRELPEAAWTEPTPGCGYELAEAVHTMAKTKAAFRMVCKRTDRRQLALPGGSETPSVYYVIATNWSGHAGPPGLAQPAGTGREPDQGPQVRRQAAADPLWRDLSERGLVPPWRDRL